MRVKCDKCGYYYTQRVVADSGCLYCKTKGIVKQMENKYDDFSETCPACKGTKVQKDRNGINILCGVCHGKGVIYRDHNGDIRKIFC